MSMDLSIVVPTFNERNNVVPIIESVAVALHDINWEIIFVDDDSPDGTADLVKQLAKEDSRIKCIRRVNRRGLTSAAIEGILSSYADCVAVMDADLQHDESLLQQMYETLASNEADIVVGSRYMEGGSTGEGLNSFRLMVSRTATTIGKYLLRVNITDPMSGYFMLRREVFEPHMGKLSGKGFKILLDILASVPGRIRIRELPYVMKKRNSGESKLDFMVASEYYFLILDKLIGRIVPVRFLMFVTVGLFGVFVHLVSLYALHRVMHFEFFNAQLIATLVAMTSNYVINNRFTYRDMRLTGYRFILGLFSFYIACSIGAMINLQIADFMFVNGIAWLIAGVTGAFVGSVWNYAITSTFTWKRYARA